MARHQQGPAIAPGGPPRNGMRQASSVSSMQRSSSFFGADSTYKPDCGTESYQYLSTERAKEYVDRTHPRVQASFNLDGTVRSYEYWEFCGTATGRHSCCGCNTPSDWSEFGSGLVMYFKGLKAVSTLLFVMSLLSLPALVVYYNGGALNEQIVSEAERLALITLGNIGEGSTVCTSALEGERLGIACPAGARIGSIEAYYGNPQGQCLCPAARTPDPDCPGSVDGDLCEPSSNPDDAYCHLDQEREVNLPSGSKFDAGPCCAAELDSGSPVFPDLDVAVDPECNSLTAQRIVRGRCIGQGVCNITVSGSALQAWVSDEGYGTECDPDFDRSRTNRDGVKQCFQSFDGAAEGVAEPLQNCPARVSNPASDNSGAGRKRLLVVAVCYQTEVDLGNGTVWTKEEVAVYVALFDVVSTVIFIFFACWLENAEHTEEKHIKYSANKRFGVADYTVYLPSLPDHDSISQLERDIRSKFEHVLSDENFRVRRPLQGDPQNPEAPSGVRVADINFGTTESGMLDLFLQRGSILNELDRAIRRRHIASMELADFRGTARPTVRENMEQAGKMSSNEVACCSRYMGCCPYDDDALRLIDEEIRKIKDKIKDKDDEIDQAIGMRQMGGEIMATCAYVTFEEEEGKDRALATYPPTFCMWLCQPNSMRINGYRVSVENAPQPSDVIWENLGVPTIERFCRQVFTTTVTFAALALSGIVLFLVEDQKRQALRTYVSTDCSLVEDVGNRDLVVQDTFWRDFNQTTGNTGRLECYCLDRFDINDPTAVLEEKFAVPDGNSLTGGTAELCRDWADTYFTVQGLVYGGALLVLFTNFLLRFLLRGLVSFERLRSRTAELVSGALKLFAITFLNTAALVVLVNASIDTDFVFLRQGEHEDFGTDWYRSVGVSLTITMILNIFVPHATPLGDMTLINIARCRDRSCSCDEHLTSTLSQAELNQLWMGPQLLLDERFAQLYSILFVCLAFSTGMPGLVPIAFLTFFLCYWVDKSLFVWVYQTPPSYDSSLSHSFTKLLPLAAFLHLIMGIWMLSNPLILPDSQAVQDASAVTATVSQASTVGSGSDTGSTSEVISGALGDLDAIGYDVAARLSRSAVIPLVIILVLLVAWLVLRYIIYSNLKLLLSCVCPCLFEGDEFDEEDYGYGTKDDTETTRMQLPNYWMALPTEVLQEVHHGLRVPKSAEARSKMEKAYHKRRKLIEQRSQAQVQLRQAIEQERKHLEEARLRHRQQDQAEQVREMTEAQLAEERRKREEEEERSRQLEAMQAALAAAQESAKVAVRTESTWQDAAREEIRQSMRMGNQPGGVSSAAMAARDAPNYDHRPQSASDKALQEIDNDDGVVHIPDEEDGYAAGTAADSALASPAKVHGDGEGEGKEEDGALVAAGANAAGVATGSMTGEGSAATSGMQRTATYLVRQQIGYTTEEAAAMAMEAERAAEEQRQRAFQLIQSYGLDMDDKELSGDFKKFTESIMSGLHSFDLHDSIAYSRILGFSANVPVHYKRRLALEATDARQKRAASFAGNGLASPAQADVVGMTPGYGMAFNQRMVHGPAIQVIEPGNIQNQQPRGQVPIQSSQGQTPQRQMPPQAWGSNSQMREQSMRETEAALQESRYFQDDSSAPMPQRSMLPPMHGASYMHQQSNVATRADGAYWAHRPEIMQAAQQSPQGYPVMPGAGQAGGQGMAPQFARMQALQQAGFIGQARAGFGAGGGAAMDMVAPEGAPGSVPQG